MNKSDADRIRTMGHRAFVGGGGLFGMKLPCFSLTFSNLKAFCLSMF